MNADDRSTMRAEAVEELAGIPLQVRREHYLHAVDVPGDIGECKCGFVGTGAEFYEHVDAETVWAILDALLSPRVVPCSECGGRGGHSMPEWQGEAEPCHACNGTGQVSLPRLAVLMGELEQVGQWHVEERRFSASRPAVTCRCSEPEWCHHQRQDRLWTPAYVRSGESSP